MNAVGGGLVDLRQGKHESRGRVVAKIAADSRKRVNDLQPMRLEFHGVADTGRHQQLGAVNRTRAQKNFTLGVDALDLATVEVLDPARSVALDHHAERSQAREDSEVDPSPGGCEVGSG